MSNDQTLFKDEKKDALSPIREGFSLCSQCGTWRSAICGEGCTWGIEKDCVNGGFHISATILDWYYKDWKRLVDAERNERHRAGRQRRQLESLQRLIHDLSAFLADEGNDMTGVGLDHYRRRVANMLPPDKCPDWLKEYRDPPVVQS